MTPVAYRLISLSILLLALLSLLVVISGRAQASRGPSPRRLRPLVLDQADRYSLNGLLQILLDPTGKLSLEQLTTSGPRHRFTTVFSTPNLGLSQAVLWGRFALENPSPRPQALLLAVEYPTLDQFTLFVPRPGGGFQPLQAGDSVPPSPQVMPHRYLVFRLLVPPTSRQLYYLRAATSGDMTLPLSLWKPQPFIRHHRRSQLWYGILFGVMAGFIIYFLMTYVLMRHLACLWFAGYLASLVWLLSIREGFFQEMVGWLGPQGHNLLTLAAIGLIYFSGAGFFRVFLDLRTQMAWADRVLQVLQWMGLFYIPVCIFRPPLTDLYALVLVGLGPLFSLGVSARLWTKGYAYAQYITLGWLVGHLTSSLDFLRIYGLIPYYHFMAYTLPVTLLSVLVFFTLALAKQNREYQFYSLRDPLTGISNRRHFDQFLEVEWKRCQRYGRPISLIMGDVDHFKLYNDSYGHRQGDVCLKRIAQAFNRFSRRPGDLAARVGGEEFAVVLSESEGLHAARLAEKIRAEVELMSIPHRASPVRPVVTISLGVSSALPGSQDQPEDLVKETDQALYRAKLLGRNQVVSSPTVLQAAAHHSPCEWSGSGPPPPGIESPGLTPPSGTDSPPGRPGNGGTSPGGAG